MVKIERHIADFDIRDMIARTERIHEKLLTKLLSSPTASSYLYSNCLEGFGYEMFSGNKEKAKYYFKTGQQAIIAHFRFASSIGEKIKVKIGDIELEAEGYETTSEISATHWRVAIAMSEILRDYHAISELLIVPESVMRKASMPGDEYNFVYVDYLKSMCDNRRNDAGQLLLKTYDAAERKNIKKSDPSTVLRLINPQLALYGDYMGSNSVEFNKDLEQALNLWKELYVTEEFMPNDPWSFVNIILTSIVALAHDKGLKIEVESDYIPKELVEGKWKI